MRLTRAQKVRLGAFMLTSLVIFGGGVVALTGAQLLEVRDEYTVYFTESVSGLEPSAPVKYQGLRVGRVDSMRVDPKGPSRIEVVISLEEGTPLYEGTEAVLDSSGLTGLKSINLKPGDLRGDPILPGSVLAADESFVGKLTDRLERITAKVEEITDRLATWTNDENLERVEKLVDSVTTLSDEIAVFLKHNRESFGRALEGVAMAGHSMAKISDEGTRSIQGVRGEINRTLAEARITLQAWRRPVEKVDPEEVQRTLVAARGAMESLDHRLSSEELVGAMGKMRTALNDLTRLLQDTDLAVRAGREDFVATLKYVRQAAEDLREFSRIIAQDPSAILRGRE